MRAFPKLVGTVYFVLVCLLGWSVTVDSPSAESPASTRTAAAPTMEAD